jgi:HicA toxin of bacterial toxin-antitoxin,
MTRIAKLYAKILSGGEPSFAELCRLAEAFGFVLKRISGSHHIYQHPNVPSNLNLQPKGKGTKLYQVTQLLDMIDANGLTLEDE